MRNANRYTSDFADSVWWLLDRDANRMAYGLTIAEAWDQLDDGPVPNDDCACDTGESMGHALEIGAGPRTT